MKTIQLRKEMGTEVLRHLSQFAALPRQGILAGQAVDSAITDLFGMGGGVYNDLDVFRACPGDSANKISRANHTAFRCELRWLGAKPEVTPGGYETMAMALDVTDSYGIASVTRQEMLNFVNCYMSSGRLGQPLTAERVINGFDLNCTRVAVDLGTGLLHWDQNYEEFVRSRQLRISMMHTPWHTFLRLIKKQKELPGVYVDLDEAAMACTAVANSKALKKLTGRHNVSMLFGEKNQQLALAFKNDISPYFRLDTVEYHRIGGAGKAGGSWSLNKGAQGESVTLWKMTPSATLDKPLQSRVDKVGPGCLFFASRMVQEHRRAKKSIVSVKLDQVIKARKASDTYPKNKALEDFVEFCASTFDSHYVEGQALPQVAAKVAAFLSKHALLKSMLVGLSLAEQAETIARINACAKKFNALKNDDNPEYQIGVIETEGTAVDLTSEELLIALLERSWAKNSVPFKIKGLKLPALPPALQTVKVKELLSPLELKKEGKDQGHCVGGYSHAVRRGVSRIIQLREDGNRKSWSTAELRVSKRGKRAVFTVAQHRARFNKDTDTRNNQALDYVVAYLNLPLEIQRKVAKDLSGAWLKDYSSKAEAKRLKAEARVKAIREQQRKAELALKAAEAAARELSTVAAAYQ